jgi:hypothetical protein
VGCQAVERSELFDAGTPAAHIAYNCERNRPVVALAMWDEAAELKKPREMVLPVRIELTTSPLPMGCSTTELRQHHRRRQRITDQRPDVEPFGRLDDGAVAPYR